MTSKPSKRDTSLLSQAVIVLALLMNFATPALATASDFFSVAPEADPAHNDVELNRIFTTGVGTYESAMEGKLYPYNLPQNGVAGRPTYNGCYDNRNNRLGPLDSDNSCTTTIAAHPGISIIRLFLGYKVYCSDGTTSGTCQDMGLFMNCQLTQVQVGTGPFEGPVGVRQCSTGNPIVRRAKANSSVVPSAIGCYPGQDGSKYPDCTPCGDGTYNDVIGANTKICTACPNPTPSGAGDKLPSKIVTDPTIGAVSVSQCMIDKSDLWTCAAGFVKTPDNQQCVAETGAAPCNLSLSLTPTNPSADNMNDGKIMATYSGADGAVTAFSITSPTAMPPTTLSGSTANFEALGHNTYTISVTDSVCTETASVALTAPTTTSCSACPSPSTASGNLCIIPSQTSCPTGFTLSSGTCTMACTSGAALPACALAMNVQQIFQPASPGEATGQINVGWSGQVGRVVLSATGGGIVVTYTDSGYAAMLKAGTYTVTATDSAIPGCKVSVTRTIIAKQTPSDYWTKCGVQICFNGLKYRYTCQQQLSTGLFTAQDYYSNLKDTCAPDTYSKDPNVLCNDPAYCTAGAPPPAPVAIPLCKNLTCGSGSIVRYFHTASALEEFATANVYSNPVEGNSCKTDCAQDLLAVCSMATPGGDACMFDHFTYYKLTGSTAVCEPSAAACM